MQAIGNTWLNGSPEKFVYKRNSMYRAEPNFLPHGHSSAKIVMIYFYKIGLSFIKYESDTHTF